MHAKDFLHGSSHAISVASVGRVPGSTWSPTCSPTPLKPQECTFGFSVSLAFTRDHGNLSDNFWVSPGWRNRELMHKPESWLNLWGYCEVRQPSQRKKDWERISIHPMQMSAFNHCAQLCHETLGGGLSPLHSDFAVATKVGGTRPRSSVAGEEPHGLVARINLIP